MQLEAVGHPVAAAAAAAAAVQGLGLVVSPMPELAVEPEPGPVVEPVQQGLHSLLRLCESTL